LGVLKNVFPTVREACDRISEKSSVSNAGTRGVVTWVEDLEVRRRQVFNAADKEK
jgi:hypothetical protein